MEGTEAASGALGKYRLIAELGHGGMAQVFLALARGPAGFNKLSVIKQIREQLAEDPEFLTMFLHEARLAARLNHPNVVQTNEVGEDGKRYFIAMEYLEGQPLNRIIQRTGRESGIPAGKHLRILCEALAGLHHAHELLDYDGTPLQVVHRDVTPHNVFVTYAGQVKVVDFGIAKALSQSAETKAGVLKGKVAYMAPEQARGDKVDRRADIFSVGVMIWEALAGRRMFKGLTDVVIIQKIVNGQLPSPRSVKPDVDERLEAVCMKAIAHNREDRYETAADLEAALEEALDATGDRSNLRDVGKLVAQQFEPERGRIKGLVEAALAGYTARSSSDIAAAGASQTNKIVGGLPVIQDPPTYDPDSHGDRPNPLHAAASTASAKIVEGTLTSSALAHKPAEPTRNRLLVPLGMAAVLAVAAIGYVALGKGVRRPQDPALASTATAPTKGRFTLTLESTPPGAAVMEDGQKIGETPMTIPLDGAWKEPRVFTLSKEGYLEYTLQQEPATGDVRVSASLTKVESPAVTAAASALASGSASTEPSSAGGARRHAGPNRTTPTSTATAPAPPPSSSSTLDIKTTR